MKGGRDRGRETERDIKQHVNWKESERDCTWLVKKKSSSKTRYCSNFKYTCHMLLNSSGTKRNNRDQRLSVFSNISTGSSSLSSFSLAAPAWHKFLQFLSSDPDKPFVYFTLFSAPLKCFSTSQIQFKWWLHSLRFTKAKSFLMKEKSCPTMKLNKTTKTLNSPELFTKLKYAFETETPL